MVQNPNRVGMAETFCDTHFTKKPMGKIGVHEHLREEHFDGHFLVQTGLCCLENNPETASAQLFV